MLLRGYWTVLGKDCLKLMTPDEETIDIARHGTLLCLTPDLYQYDADLGEIMNQKYEDTMKRFGNELNCSDATPVSTSIDAVEQLKILINSIEPRVRYHTDTWQLDEANSALTRARKQPRRTMFVPRHTDCLVELDRLIDQNHDNEFW